MIQGMNHFTITAEDRAKTLDFYCGLLGLVEGHRPDLGFPGAWLYPPGGTQAVLHIYWDRPMPSQRTGVIDHLAFTASGLKAVKARFDERGLKYDLRRQAGTGDRPGVWQLFSLDPNGAKVELDFDPAETP
jgi:catechol 2,3-dioxygenase-like lactoylglutathione lyase family enzyme